jgi:hypothetical protein
MFKNFRIASILLIVAALLLGGGCLAMTWLYLSETKKTSELEQQLAELNKLERRHLIEESIYDQTKAIANDQLKISYEQAIKADSAAKVAKKKAEEALAAQKEAEQSEAEAKKQERIAKKNERKAKEQELIANEQRNVAETQRKAADTLRYLALARSLGSQSSQIRSNDPEKADLLAYASYYFTNKYKQRESDLYNSAVFNALTEGSYTKQIWPMHTDATTAISFDRDKGTKDDRFVTVSSYGEIKRHTFDDVKNVLTKTETIFANSQYDFRDVIYKKGTIYALSFTGHLVVKKDEWNSPRIILLPDIFRPTAFCEMGDNELCIIGSQSVGIFDKNSLTLTGAKSFDFNIVCLGKDFNSLPILFDNYGRMHILKSLNEITTKKVPQGVVGQVTAYANSKSEELEAYGTKNGTIYVVKNNGKPISMTGHESRITKLKLINKKIYSSSYDGKLNLWIYSNDKKIEPLMLLNTHEWMYNFDIDKNKERVWTGGKSGTITKSLIKIDLMVDKMEKEILPKRKKFNDEDWNLYIGADIERIPLIYEGKEGRK